MSQPVDIRSYPSAFHALSAALCSTPARPITLTFDSTGDATHFRQKFYSFRKLLLHASEASQFEPLRQVHIRLSGTTLTFDISTSIDEQLAAQGIALAPEITPSPELTPLIESATRAFEVKPEEAIAAAAKFEEALKRTGLA